MANEEPKDDAPQDFEKLERLRIDENADFHARISTLESGLLRMSRRITRLEDGGKGHYSGDDPLAGIFSPGLVWAMVALTLAPLIIEGIKQWKSSSSSQ